MCDKLIHVVIKYVLKSVLLVLFLTPQTAFAESLQGSWKLLSGEYVNAEGKVVEYDSLKLNAIKVLSDSHFSFVSMSERNFWASGAGTYMAIDGWYIETPTLNSFNSDPTKQYKFQYTLNENVWTLERWHDGTRVEFEVWQKTG